MSDPFHLTTTDPRFDPDKPVRVNGYLFLPAKRVLAGVARHDKPLVEVKRRKVLT